MNKTHIDVMLYFSIMISSHKLPKSVTAKPEVCSL